jgi:DNA polymerase-3 subunit alpha
MIRENRGVPVDLERLPEDDAITFDLFARGDTVGVFQFESSGMQDWLRKLKPTCMSDLVAMNALYRPGPMEMIGDFIARKHGNQKIATVHAALDPILRETYGVIVYQEQVMKIASDVAGFSLAKADLMRRAMGKKDKALMATLKKEFVGGASSRGTDPKTASEIFDLIEKFASYGFNKSHSVAYSIIAYQTAYLKAHYPAEFMAATLTSEMGDTDRIVKLIDDCRRRGINVLPPDVNESGKDFRVVGTAIRFGLVAIKNVGSSAIETVMCAREKGGKFENLFSFCRRVDLRLVNRKCLESLVQAGAFDTMGPHRARHFENIERAMSFGQAAQSPGSIGQANLFETGGVSTVAYPVLLDQEPWSELVKLAREKNVLGFYVSGHPLLRFESEINEFANVHLGDASGVRAGSTVRACGIVTSVRRKVDKRNNMMAFVGLEDFSGKGECIVFADAYARYQSILQPDGMVMVVGRGEINGEMLRILVQEVYPLEQVREKFTRSIVLSIRTDSVREDTIRELRQLLEQNQGNVPCYLRVQHEGGVRMFQSRRYSVSPTNSFVSAVASVLGPESVRCTSEFSTRTASSQGSP